MTGTIEDQLDEEALEDVEEAKTESARSKTKWGDLIEGDSDE